MFCLNFLSFFRRFPIPTPSLSHKVVPLPEAIFLPPTMSQFLVPPFPTILSVPTYGRKKGVPPLHHSLPTYGDGGHFRKNGKRSKRCKIFRKLTCSKPGTLLGIRGSSTETCPGRGRRGRRRGRSSLFLDLLGKINNFLLLCLVCFIRSALTFLRVSVAGPGSGDEPFFIYQKVFQS